MEVLPKAYGRRKRSRIVASGAAEPPLNPMLEDPVRERFLERESQVREARSTRLGSWTLAYIIVAAIAALVILALLLAR